MASFINKNAGKRLLRRTKLLNGLGNEPIKFLSHDEKHKLKMNIPIMRNSSQKNNRD